jgi:ABC-type sugar transport system ATPase subunit
LEAKGIVKIFGGTTALNGVDFNLKYGEVHAVVGENGAGKSTLMKIFSGVYRKTSGRIFFRNKEININTVFDSQNLGISMIYQELSNLPKLSVAENICLGKMSRSKFGIVNFKKIYTEVGKLFERYNVNINPMELMGKLTIAEKQFVEILKAISVKNTKIVIMDEPTSSLTKEEIKLLFSIIEQLKKEGVSIIYISHRLDEIVEIADRVSVFRDGKNRGTRERGSFDQNEIINMMLGHTIEEFKKVNVTQNEVILEIRNLDIPGRVADFNLKLHKGEIVGVAGLMGSGKDELVKSLFGLWPTATKEIFFKGKKIHIEQPNDAIRHGITYLPEERKTLSVFSFLNVEENIIPVYLVKNKIFLVNENGITNIVDQCIKLLSIKTASSKDLIDNLSGGNQQKVVFSRLLAVKPEVMILNDPTRGVDVGSKDEIYKIVRNLANEGVSVMFLSSELQELVQIADRVIVLSRGEMVGEFIEDISLKNILTCAVRARV